MRDLKLWVGWFLVVAVLVWLMLITWAMATRGGLFDLSRGLDNELGSAVWGFLGTGVVALGALVAALFTYSYNVRTLRLDKNEAMSKLLGLLTTDDNSGKRPTAAQTVGVVIGLQNLGEPDVAAGVLEAAIETDDLTPGTTVRLLDKPLRSKDKDDQTNGARLLMAASLRSLTEESTRSYAWPKALSHWPEDFGKDAKQYILVAVGRTLATQDTNFWKGQRDWAVFLAHDALADSNPSVKDGAWLLLRTILDAKKEAGKKDVGIFTRASDNDHPPAELGDKALEDALKGGTNWRWNPLVRFADEALRKKWCVTTKTIYAHLISD